MKTMYKKIFFVALFLVLLTGCSDVLSKDKEVFSGQGVSYAFRLPATWKESSNVQETYNRQAVYGAEDTKSNSHLFVLTYLKKEVDRDDFAKKTRLELQKRYNYKELSGVYMKEYKINQHKAIKYTLNTKFKEKDVWAHFYYVETEHGFVEMIFYSANDGEYKKRSEIIDASVETLVETEAKTVDSTVGESETEDESGDTIEVKNERMTIVIDGVMKLPDGDKKSLMIIRYQVTNSGDAPLVPNDCQQLIKATQNEKVLAQGTISEENPELDVKDLVKNGTKSINKGETIEAALVYELSTDDQQVLLNFSKEEFKDQPARMINLPE